MKLYNAIKTIALVSTLLLLLSGCAADVGVGVGGVGADVGVGVG